MNDITFIGVNLTQELQKQLDSHKSAILSTAPPDAVKGYNLGVQNTLLSFFNLNSFLFHSGLFFFLSSNFFLLCLQSLQVSEAALAMQTAA